MTCCEVATRPRARHTRVDLSRKSISGTTKIEIDAGLHVHVACVMCTVRVG